MCYYKHELKTYTTAITSITYKWHELIQYFFSDFIKKTATIGAEVKVIHHTGLELGSVIK